jgi:Lrp/AsnC family leucine-responsive transcriptional regulator
VLFIHTDGFFRYVDAMMKAIDETDRGIISTLEHDGRASLAEIGKIVGLSGPAVGERLQSDGVVEEFIVCVDAKALGYTLEAFVRIKPRSKQLHNVERMSHVSPPVIG